MRKSIFINEVNSKCDPDYTETEHLKIEYEIEDCKKKKSYTEIYKEFVHSITIEPCMFLFVTAFVINNLSNQNLSLEKACRVNLNFSEDICTSLKLRKLASQNQYERETQKILALALPWKSYIVAIIPGLLSTFIGSWSDKTGRRKIFLVIALSGQALISFNSMLHCYFFDQLNLEYLIFTEAIIESLTGGWCICILVTYSYIGAISDVQTRTFRLGIINFFKTVGFPIGMMTGGVLLKKFGYYGSFGLSVTLQICNIVYATYFLKDPPRTEKQKMHDKKGVKYFFRTFFDLTNAKNSLKTAFKSGPNHRRLRMCVLLFAECVLFGPFFGEIAILYMSTRYRFNWDEMQFSIFQTYNFVIHTVGTMISIILFSKMWQWHDSMLGIISSISKILASFVYCFATTGKLFYLGPVLEIFNGTGILAVKSIVSKSVPTDELGKVNSIFGLGDNLMPLIYVPLYTMVYLATMKVLPGAVFLMGAALILPAVIIFIIFFAEHRRGLKKTKQVEITNFSN